MAAAAPKLDLVMKTLADPTRRAMYQRIVDAGEVTATSLVKGARVSQPAVSQHLRALHGAGLVSERREGRNVHYSATPRGLAPLVDWLGDYGHFWRERFSELEKLLGELSDE